MVGRISEFSFTSNEPVIVFTAQAVKWRDLSYSMDVEFGHSKLKVDDAGIHQRELYSPELDPSFNETFSGKIFPPPNFIPIVDMYILPIYPTLLLFSRS